MLIPACNTSRTPSAEEQAREQRITEKVENRDFTIEVTQANPMRGKNIHLSYGYDLRIKNDSAFAYLPYFGVVRSAPYGGDGGIKFETEMQNFQITQVKDGWNIRFKARDRGNDYDFLLNVFKNGSSTISVNSQYRDPISFYGNVRE